MKRKRHKRIPSARPTGSVVWVVVGLAIALGAAPSNARRLDTEVTRVVELSGQRRVYVKNARGKTIVIGREDIDAVSVRAQKIVKAHDTETAEDLMSRLDFNITTDPDRIAIVTDHPDEVNPDRNFWKLLFKGKDRAYVDYTIEVPSRFDAKVSSASGDVQITSLHGDATVLGSSGDVFLKDLGGEVVVEISSGDVEVRNVAGDVRVRLSSGQAQIRQVQALLSVYATSGDIFAYEVGGDAKIELASGNFVVNGCEGSLNAKTTSGDGEIAGIGGDINATAASGDLFVDIAPAGNREFNLMTTSGDIEIRFQTPTRYGFYLEVHTSSGSIEGDLDIKLDEYSRRMLKGLVGNGGGKLYVETSSGNVRIQQASR